MFVGPWETLRHQHILTLQAALSEFKVRTMQEQSHKVKHLLLSQKAPRTVVNTTTEWLETPTILQVFSFQETVGTESAGIVSEGIFVVVKLAERDEDSIATAKDFITHRSACDDLSGR